MSYGTRILCFYVLIHVLFEYIGTRILAKLFSCSWLCTGRNGTGSVDVTSTNEALSLSQSEHVIPGTNICTWATTGILFYFCGEKELESWIKLASRRKGDLPQSHRWSEWKSDGYSRLYCNCCANVTSFSRRSEGLQLEIQELGTKVVQNPESDIVGLLAWTVRISPAFNEH